MLAKPSEKQSKLSARRAELKAATPAARKRAREAEERETLRLQLEENSREELLYVQQQAAAAAAATAAGINQGAKEEEEEDAGKEEEKASSDVMGSDSD